MSGSKTIKPNFHDKTPEGAAYRVQQARVDADIEGMARDPEIAALCDRWRAEGVPTEEFINRLTKVLKAADVSTLAAE